MANPMLIKAALQTLSNPTMRKLIIGIVTGVLVIIMLVMLVRSLSVPMSFPLGVRISFDIASVSFSFIVDLSVFATYYLCLIKSTLTYWQIYGII